MLNDILKKLIRWTIIFIFWVFIFSININGRTIFYYSNNFFVKNKFVLMLDEELERIWYKLKKISQVAFEDIEETRKRSL